MKTRIYYIACDNKVHFVSVQYHEACTYRDQLTTDAAEQPGMCQMVHTVLTKDVTLP